MKKLFLTLIVAFTTVCGFAQEIKSVDTKFEDYQLVATFDDCLSLLQQAGYNMFVYDISSLKDKATHVEFCVKEYENGNLVEVGDSRSRSSVFELIRRISEYSEEEQRVIKASAIADDEDNDIFRLATRLKIGFTPVGADMEQRVQFEVAGKVQMALFSKLLSLRDNRMDKSHRKLDYYTRPFIIDGFEKGKFIPLVLYAAPWWDEKYETYRLCGETKIPADMSSQVMKLSPHYFIIGVEFE
ncbi:MAG: DUF5041 domain-containing protein [Bacteroidaceae bacterium]|nr:DUF5041 domain-containing protein [Bacteroidaceae bacterium]